MLNKFNNYLLAVNLFGRLLGLNCLIAFISLMIQLPGLISDHGLFPVSKIFTHTEIMQSNWFICPSLVWLMPNLTAMIFLGFLGTVLASLTMFGYLRGLVFLLMYILYLSLCKACGPFTEFQWDALLLESCFLAVFLYPFRLGLRSPQANIAKPNPYILPLYWFLLFKLMLGSGLVKLTNGDNSWMQLQALWYHFATQPLPNPIAYIFNQLPHMLLDLGVILVLVIELVFPFFIFLNQRLRILAAGCFIFLQLLIAFTGNYAFFNLLTITLSILLLNDEFLTKIIPHQFLNLIQLKLPPTKSNLITTSKNNIQNLNPELLTLISSEDSKLNSRKGFQLNKLGHIFKLCLPLSLLMLGIIKLGHSLNLVYELPFSQIIENTIDPFLIDNSYGLFAVMTKTRPEIIIEGSCDGINFYEYTFKFKPGPLNRVPPIIAPYQPRLDWQLWFIALDENNLSPILKNLVSALMQNYQPVLALLDKNPFPDKPPTIIKVYLYDYHFTNFKQLLNTGNFWTRDHKREYFEVKKQIFKQ